MTSAEMEVVRSIKEECCVVALNASKEEQSYMSNNKAHQYQLPDGSYVDVSI